MHEYMAHIKNYYQPFTHLPIQNKLSQTILKRDMNGYSNLDIVWINKRLTK